MACVGAYKLRKHFFAKSLWNVKLVLNLNSNQLLFFFRHLYPDTLQFQPRRKPTKPHRPTTSSLCVVLVFPYCLCFSSLFVFLVWFPSFACFRFALLVIFVFVVPSGNFDLNPNSGWTAGSVK